MRPPLNRAIPPIPESKSNDSIITHIPEKHTETHAKLEPSTSQVLREPSCVKSIGELVASFTAKISSQKIESEGSLIIENTMAHSLVTKTAVIISNRNGRSEDVPRSPLMSVAHSVRSKLTKFGSRFSRSDENQNIRTSTSLSSMRRGPVDKLSYIPPNTQFKKSASMETRTNQNSTKDSIEFFPSRQILGSNALRIPRIPRSRTSLNDQSLDLKTSKENVLLNHDKYSELIRPKDLPSKSGNEKTNSIVKAFKVHLEPRATQTVSRPDRIRQLNSPIVAFTMTTEVHASKNQENIKEGKGKPTMNVFVETSTERDAYLISDMRSQQKRNDSKNDEHVNAKNTDRKRSFIPLYTTLSRRLSARKSGAEIGQAPLAECESSCIENSPAVEVPPVKFILGRNHYSCTEESIRAQKKVKKGVTGSQSLDLISSTNSVREPCSNQLLSYKSTHNCGKAIRKGSLDDKRKNDWTTINVRLSDNITNNTLPNNSSTNCSCDNDLKSENSPNDFVSPAIMTSSGFTTSSGFQDSPDKSPDKDGEFNEQFVDKTITQKFVFLGIYLNLNS
ncbi:Na(+)/H(+) antiporter NhaS4 [Dirofilaria immitis]